jgi:hypothetical protein
MGAALGHADGRTLSYAQVTDGENGQVTANVTPVAAIATGVLTRLTQVVEVRLYAQSADFSFAYADSLAEALALAADKWFPVPAGALHVVPCVDADKKVFVKAAAPTAVYWSAQGFRAQPVREPNSRVL